MGSSASSYSVGGRVAQSTSLYSMSSGASFISGESRRISYSSKHNLMKQMFTGNSSASHCSNSSGSSDGMSSTASSSSIAARHGNGSVVGDRSPSQMSSHHPSHPHSGSCSDGCSGAYPRNTHPPPHLHQFNSHHRRSKSCRVTELNRLPPIKEFRSPTKVPMPSPTNNPKIR